MFKLAKKALHDGWSIVMFPAGTRKRHKLVPFKTGAFLLAAEKGVPVVPVSLQLPEDLWAARRGTRCQLRVVFHQPIMVKLDPDTEGAPVDTQQESHADKANETPKQGEEQGLSVEEASTEAFKKIVAGLGPGYYES
jgi:1-acyl-sn-glycerol-3-phosphate acyltransferase